MTQLYAMLHVHDSDVRKCSVIAEHGHCGAVVEFELCGRMAPAL